MQISGLNQLVDGVFVSELIGCPKPMKEYYDACFSNPALTGTDRSECLIVGDSLTSDMKGANNAGIAACWYNPTGAVNDKAVAIDYEIRCLEELYPILGLS